MRRREFIALLGGTMAGARASLAQARISKVGVLMTNAQDREGQLRFDAIREGLAKLGWREGESIHLEARWAPTGNSQLIRKYAEELVALRPDVLVAHNTPGVMAVLELTRSIPVIFVPIVDPVGQGFVASLARPGGNASGFTNFEPEMGSKWLQIMRELVPTVRRAVILFNPVTAPYTKLFTRSFDGAVKTFGMSIELATVYSADEIKPAIADTAEQPDTTLVVMPDGFTTVNRKEIISAAAAHRVPAIYPYGYMARDGGLISYGVDVVDLFRRTPAYIDQILRGAAVGNLPVQGPTKFELVINLKTARELGIEVPINLLARADEVIE